MVRVGIGVFPRRSLRIELDTDINESWERLRCHGARLKIRLDFGLREERVVSSCCTL